MRDAGWAKTKIRGRSFEGERVDSTWIEEVSFGYLPKYKWAVGEEGSGLGIWLYSSNVAGSGGHVWGEEARQR